MIEVRQCDAGHLSLDAANWECPWCEVERLRTEMHDCSDRDTRAFASLQAQAHRQHERGEKTEKQTEIWRSAHDGLRQDRDEWRSASQMHEAEVERLREALVLVAEWKMPDTVGRDGKPSTYGLEYGSNGERDYVRGIARAALRGGGE